MIVKQNWPLSLQLYSMRHRKNELCVSTIGIHIAVHWRQIEKCPTSSLAVFTTSSYHFAQVFQSHTNTFLLAKAVSGFKQYIKCRQQWPKGKLSPIWSGTPRTALCGHLYLALPWVESHDAQWVRYTLQLHQSTGNVLSWMTSHSL